MPDRVKTAVIESFRKAFLLTLDVILGWIFANRRIFNRANGTIIVKVKEGEYSASSKNVKR